MERSIAMEKKDLQIKTSQALTNNIPWPQDTLRALVLKEAGITPEELGRLAKKAIQKAEEKLEAKETHIVHYQGKIYEVREVEAHQVQLTAAKQLMELAGTFPSRFRDGEKDQQNIQVNIILPWGNPGEPNKAV